MAVARAVYGDLVVINLTIGAASHPNSTNVPKLITNLYKQGYRAIGATYAVYDAAAEHAIIDTEEFKEIIVSEAEEIVNIWHFSGKENPPPSSKMSKEGIVEIKSLLKRSPNRLSNVRVMGNTWDDY